MEVRKEITRSTLLQVSLEGPLGLLLLRYLRTDAGAEQRTPGFSLPRSADVDALLCRLVLDAEDVTVELSEALARLVEGESMEPGEFGVAWSARTAAAIHHLDTLEDRLRAYVGAYWKESCSRFGFADFEATEPPEEDLPANPAMKERADDPVPARAPAWVHQRFQRTYFERRLNEEVCRSVRGLGGFSLLAFEAIADRLPFTGERPGASFTDAAALHVQKVTGSLVRTIRRGLRPYDVCAGIGGERIGVLLPGATTADTPAVVARLRYAFEEVLGATPVALGAATWPDHGVNGSALLKALDAAVESDRRRLETGEVEFDSIPPFMVDRGDCVPERRGRLWLEGFGEGIAAEITVTPSGMRLRAPLGFLREGMAVRLGEPGRMLRGRVRGVLLGQSAPGQAPVLQLDIDPTSR